MNPTTPSLAITWQQPTFLLPLFCLCPLLASSNSLAAALGLSGVMAVIVITTVLLTATLSRLIATDISTPIWLLCCGGIMAVVELILHATCYELYRVQGLFLSLTVVASLLLARPEMQAQQHSIKHSLWRALLMIGGFTLAAGVLATARELIGHGSLFHDAGMLFGNWAQPLSMQVFRVDRGFLLAVLAPGAFIGLGIGVALYNWLWLRLSKHNHP